MLRGFHQAFPGCLVPAAGGTVIPAVSFQLVFLDAAAVGIGPAQALLETISKESSTLPWLMAATAFCNSG